MLAGFFLLGAYVPRDEFGWTIAIFTGLFMGMLVIYFLAPPFPKSTSVFFAGIMFRLILLFSSPEWSDDFARFLWDGELLTMGENPYESTPESWKENNPDLDNAYLKQLFELLNSPEYYSVYPPLNQGIFWIAAKASSGFVWNGYIALRIMLIAGEVVTFWMLVTLLRMFGVQQRVLWLYWGNPLIVMEISGNLHFEGLVLTLLLGSIMLLSKKKEGGAGFLWGLAIGVKLLPLMLGPALVSFRQTRRAALFWWGTVLAVVLGFVWLAIDNSWINFLQSLQLYQGKFEFNASVYYIAREVGFWLVGYNLIMTLTRILSLLALLLILYFSWRRKPHTLGQLVDLYVLMYLIYLVFQPVIHPWYVIPGFGLSLLTQRRAFLVWTYAVIFSYQAYGNPGFHELSYLLFIEYGLLFGAVYLDYFRRGNTRMKLRNRI